MLNFLFNCVPLETNVTVPEDISVTTSPLLDVSRYQSRRRSKSSLDKETKRNTLKEKENRSACSNHQLRISQNQTTQRGIDFQDFLNVSETLIASFSSPFPIYGGFQPLFSLFRGEESATRTTRCSLEVDIVEALYGV